MGNSQSGSLLTRTSGALDSFVAELGTDVVYEKSVGSARFLKTVKCRHRNGFIVVKIFIKPEPDFPLRSYHRRLKADKEALMDIPNIYNYQSFLETDKAGYMIRQWVASNLYDRISTRPFLSIVEKKWIAFQLITALRDAKNRKISHGDLKSENILVTSWNWVYLSDFASYKPTYLPLDDPSEFSLYFDSSGRRTCYIAPERFYTNLENLEFDIPRNHKHSIGSEIKRDMKVTEAMDCFSTGCVIAELFLEGAPLFTLSQLFKYRSGEYNVEGPLSAVEDENIRNMIKQMIALEPNARPSFDNLLHTSRGDVFPESFFSLYNYVASVNEMSSSTPFNPPPLLIPVSNLSPLGNATSTVAGRPGLSTSPNTEPTCDVLPSDSDRRIERIWVDFESLEPYLALDLAGQNVTENEENDLILSKKPFQAALPVELYIPNRESKLKPSLTARSAVSEDGPTLIVLALITANIRNCSLPSSKVHALDLMLSIAAHLTDEAKLDRMVPYIVDLLHDDTAITRLSAFRTLIQILMMVTVITPSNAAIFPEYIIPNIRDLINDPEVSVRCMYAQCIVRVAETAVRYLEMGQALRAHGTLSISPEAQEYSHAQSEVSYDASMQELQGHIEEHLTAILMDPSSVVKRAVLHDISYLCIFLGKQKTNDVLLSHMITYLNDRDWQLRYAFFESIVDVAACAGGRSLEEYILPLMIQALSDVEEMVVAKVLAALTSLCELGLFQKMRIWELMSATLGFLHHPNVWIRQGSAAFIASSAKHLPNSDVWCILYPSLRHFLRTDITDVDEFRLLTAMKPPLSRHIFDAGVQWAMKSDKSAFWRGKRPASLIKADVGSPRDSVISLRKGYSSINRYKSEQDEAQLFKLQQLGMTSTEETKLVAMRDYMLKLAMTMSSFASRPHLELDLEKNPKTIGDVELTKLGIVPQTVFLKSRVLDPSARSPIVSPRMSSDIYGHIGSPRPGSSRVVGLDSAAAPFEDLRRRLASINASASSLSVPHSPREPRSPGSPVSFPHPSIPASPRRTSTLNRPSSPTESTISTSNSSSFRPLSRMQIGSSDTQKAAPAVGSSRMNAVGLLDTHSKMHSEESSEISGRNSPSNTIRMVSSRHRPLIPVSTYDGQEPSINNLLEKLYLDNNRELQQDFGPRVREGPIRRRNPVRRNFSSRDDGTRRMDAILVAHLTSHSDCITGLVVSPDHMFFVSASDDKTVKIWDTVRLERNVTSKPRHTYGQHHAKVKCICMLETSHCFASAAEDGSLHVVRVHTNLSGNLPKYGKLQVIREHRVDEVGEYIIAMAHYNTELTSSLIYGTSHSNIKILDLRTMTIIQSMQNPRHFGPITTICIDRKRCWILIGTSAGLLTLWDRRFGLLLKSWHAGVSLPGTSVHLHHCIVHPSKGKGKWVMVTIEALRPEDGAPTNLVEVWDIENSVLVEIFVSRKASSHEPSLEPFEVAGVDANVRPSSAIAALVRSRETTQKGQLNQFPSSPSPNVRAIVTGLDFGGHSSGHRSDLIDQEQPLKQGRVGYMITGSEDRRIRFWNLAKPERSTLLSSPEDDSERPVYSSQSNGSATNHIETWVPTNMGSQNNRAQQRISLITHNQQNLLKAHQDVITCLACIDSPFRGGIVSGDRAGVIKVWRAEMGES